MESEHEKVSYNFTMSLLHPFDFLRPNYCLLFFDDVKQPTMLVLSVILRMILNFYMFQHFTRSKKYPAKQKENRDKPNNYIAL